VLKSLNATSTGRKTLGCGGGEWGTSVSIWVWALVGVNERIWGDKTT